MNYNVDYFINKFKAIPEKRIIVLSQNDGSGNHCAYGWCKSNPDSYSEWGEKTEEGKALLRLLSSIPNMVTHHGPWTPYEATPARINNGEVQQYQQPTPKQRILASLYDVKRLQQGKSGDKAVEEANEIISKPVEELEMA